MVLTKKLAMKKVRANMVLLVGDRRNAFLLAGNVTVLRTVMVRGSYLFFYLLKPKDKRISMSLLEQFERIFFVVVVVVRHDEIGLNFFPIVTLKGSASAVPLEV